MKLLFAIKRLQSAVGGAERVLCALCSELAVRGHDVTILTFDEPGSEPFYPLHDRVRRIELGIGNSASKATLMETLSRIRALRKTVINQNPDIVVGFMHSMFVLLAAALVGTGVKVIGSEHIVPEHYKSRPLQFLLLLATSPMLSNMTVLSASIRESYPRPIRKKMIVQPNPTIPAKGRANIDQVKKQYVILNVARLDDQKDHAILIKAFSIISASHPDWILRIVGEGELRHSLESMIYDLGLEKKVQMPGVTQDIDEQYRSSDIFALSSRYESFGLVTAEAMSYGLPVVGFADCPGTNELIQDGITGLLVKPGDDRAKSLAVTLGNLISDPELRKRLGEAGQGYIENKYSLEQVCDAWELMLSGVGLSGRKHRRQHERDLS